MTTPGSSDRGIQTEACGYLSPESAAERGVRGAENKEDGGEKRPGGQAGSVVFLASSSSGVWGAESAVAHPARPTAS